MIENMKNNSQKIYQATPIIQQRGPKIPLLLESNHGVTTNEEEQVSKITTFFASFFDDKNVKDLLKAEPCKMRQPFTAIEISKSIASLKNKKYPGIDSFKAKHLKHGPYLLSEKISNILNNCRKGGKANRINPRNPHTIAEAMFKSSTNNITISIAQNSSHLPNKPN